MENNFDDKAVPAEEIEHDLAFASEAKVSDYKADAIAAENGEHSTYSNGQ